MTVLTNNEVGGFDTLIMFSNSPQAAFIAATLDPLRSSQPNRTFRSIGDRLAIPELSTASPWLDTNGTYQIESSMNDEAGEAIPSQILPLLWPDSMGGVSQSGGTRQVQFSGINDCAYVGQTSSNLVDWAPVSTNYPTSGTFNFRRPVLRPASTALSSGLKEVQLHPSGARPSPDAAGLNPAVLIRALSPLAGG